MTQREQARRVAVKESRISDYIKVARALPEVWARGVAAQMDVPAAKLEGLPRKALRVIADVQDAAERDRLLREALMPRPKPAPPSLTSPGEVSEPTAEFATTLLETLRHPIKILGFLLREYVVPGGRIA